MKVKDLINRLKSLDLEAEVIVIDNKEKFYQTNSAFVYQKLEGFNRIAFIKLQ